MLKFIEAEIYGSPTDTARMAAERGIEMTFVREASRVGQRVSVIRCGEQSRELLRQWAMEHGVFSMHDVEVTYGHV